MGGGGGVLALKVLGFFLGPGVHYEGLAFT